jgi:hypothetical protein
MIEAYNGLQRAYQLSFSQRSPVETWKHRQWVEGRIESLFGAKIFGGVALSNIQLSGLRRVSLAATGLALASGVFFSGTQTASATPSTGGFYPTTDIYAKGNVHYDADAYTTDDLKDTNSTTNGLTFGLGPERDGLLGRTEVGFDYNFTGGLGSNSFSNRILGNFKTQLYNNDDSATRVVFGGWGLGGKRFNPNYLYLLASKNFNGNRVHVGAARALSTNLTDRTSLQLGFDRYITPKLQFVADYYSGKSGFAGVQPTLYYFLNDKSDLGLGYFRNNNRTQGNARDQIYICFDYNFDFKTAVSQKPPVAPEPETVPGAPAVN